MKVDLFPKRDCKSGWHNHEYGPRPQQLKKSRPFFLTRTASRTHRVRAVCLHLKWTNRLAGEYCVTHISVSLWCDQTGFVDKRGGLLLDEPIEDLPICGTCEGRATGAGQIKSEILCGHSLLYSPRKLVKAIESEATQ